jgi:hypothetical protein
MLFPSLRKEILPSENPMKSTISEMTREINLPANRPLKSKSK